MAGNVEIVAHPDIFNERVARDDRAVDKQIGIPFSQKFLEASCRLRLTSEPVEVAKGIVTTGQVPRGFGPEPRDARLLVREGDRLAADPLLDDMSLVLTAGDGLVVLFGCCHAGIINTLEHVTRLFNAAVMTVMGGTHLAHADDVVLRESVLAVKHRYGARNAYVGHCTGTRGLLAFAEVFGEHGSACPSGLTCEF
jgi:7,8-dihydropterin-6-yl-methyl-4-(beta-D-ribofuranosyl)aminobenzene 5'-phosphate synthase